MNDLIEAVKAWPIIVQGSLGSALFWFVLLIAQKLFELSSSLYSKHSTASRESYLVSKVLKYDAFTNGDPFLLNVVLYRSYRFLYKSLMWLALGLFIHSFIPVIGSIGFIGCLYYLFKAYQVIAPWSDDEENKMSGMRNAAVDELKQMGRWPEEKN